MLRRYLTPFYGFALGLALVLAFSGCERKGSVKAGADTTTKEAISTRTAAPSSTAVRAEIRGTPTVLPAIPATPDVRTPSALGVTEAELQGLQVSLWHPWTGSTGAALQTILDDFNRNNQWGISVQARGYEGFGRLDEAVEAAINSNSLPDVIVDYGYQAQHWDDRQVLTDLEPYVTDPVWGLSGDEQADFFQNFWTEDLITDRIIGQTRRLGIPFYRSAYSLFYNQSWAEELGYPNPPSTMEDLRVRACAAAEAFAKQGDKSDLGKGGYLLTAQPGELVGWMYAFGGRISDPYEPGYLFNTPQTEQAFEYLKDLQAGGCAWFEADGAPQTEFANQQALFVVGSLFDITAQQEAFAQAGNGDEWTVIPFPSNTQGVVDTYGPSLLMSHTQAAEQLAAWLVMEWLVYPPHQAEIARQLEVYPTRQSSLSYLDTAAETSSQWAEALRLIPDARGEPSLASWRVMRWALEDAATQLFSQQFSADQIPDLLGNLESLAVEIFNQVR